MKIIKQDYLTIPFDEMEEGEIIVCLDPKNRLGHETYGVLKHYIGAPEPLGLFWDLEYAKKFAAFIE